MSGQSVSKGAYRMLSVPVVVHETSRMHVYGTQICMQLQAALPLPHLPC